MTTFDYGPVEFYAIGFDGDLFPGTLQQLEIFFGFAERHD